MMTSIASIGADAAEGVFPDATWAVRQPGEVGLDPAGLDRFREVVGGRGCIVRHGYLVYTWGDFAKRGDVASAAKPVYAHFLFKALEDGKIKGLDEPVVPLEPRLAGLNAGLSHKDRGLTWRHLANQTSCYGVSEAPGTAYCYNDWQMALFWDLLFLKVYGASPATVDADVFRPLLTEPLGCEDNPTLLAFGTGDRAGRLAISPRDFARFGLLYARHGNWRGRQLLRRDLVSMAVSSPLPSDLPQSAGTPSDMLPGQRTMGSRNIPDNQTDHFGSYSWLWWTNGVDRHGKRHWAEAPLDLYGCFGHGGPRVMAVIPSLDLIVSWNEASVKSREAENEAFRRLAAAAEGIRLRSLRPEPVPSSP